MIGVHVSKISKVLDDPNKKRKTMTLAIKSDAMNLNIGAVQIFTHGPANTRKNKMNYKSIKEYCSDKNINLYVHSSWSVDESNKATGKPAAAISHFIDQMESCDAVGALGLVVHLPKKEPQVIINTFKVIAPLLKKYNTPVLLEMTSVKPDDEKTYETPKKINRLTKMILKNFPKLTWGWVPDTAHLWGAGIEIDEIKIMTKWLKNLAHPELVKLVHLNGGSIETFGTGKDKHKVVFGDEDDIWNPTFDGEKVYDSIQASKSSLAVLSAFTKKYNIDCICEINRGGYDEITFSIETLKKIFE
jgi:endonuclease IV